jgi:hypothetical protein
MDKRESKNQEKTPPGNIYDAFVKKYFGKVFVFSCPLKNGDVTKKAVIVFEHISSSLKKLPIKLHAYVSAMWTAEVKEGKKTLSALYFPERV